MSVRAEEGKSSGQCKGSHMGCLENATIQAVLEARIAPSVCSVPMQSGPFGSFRVLSDSFESFRVISILFGSFRIFLGSFGCLRDLSGSFECFWVLSASFVFKMLLFDFIIICSLFSYFLIYRFSNAFSFDFYRRNFA